MAGAPWIGRGDAVAFACNADFLGDVILTVPRLCGWQAFTSP
jgi:hypothetical protein